MSALKEVSRALLAGWGLATVFDTRASEAGETVFGKFSEGDFGVLSGVDEGGDAEGAVVDDGGDAEGAVVDDEGVPERVALGDAAWCFPSAGLVLSVGRAGFLFFLFGVVAEAGRESEKDEVDPTGKGVE